MRRKGNDGLLYETRSSGKPHVLRWFKVTCGSSRKPSRKSRKPSKKPRKPSKKARKPSKKARK
jgi:hypothetical protein